MTVTTWTNRFLNPAAAATTNWSAVAGTGGTAALSNVTTGGPAGINGLTAGVPTFNRVTWSVATTAVSGGISVDTTAGAAFTAGTVNPHIYVRSSKAQTVALTAQQYNGATATASATSAAVALAANTWTRLTVAVTAAATDTRQVLTVAATTGGSNWAASDKLDATAADCVPGGYTGAYFDGNGADINGVVYAWTAAVNASTSTATVYQPVITLTTGTSPSPYVQVTVQDLDPNTDVVNIWRTVDGRRRPVRGGRHRSVVGSDFVNDYEAPLGRSTAYDLEILSGVCAGVSVTTASTTITGQACGWLSDPLFPGSAIPVYADVGPNGEPGLDDDALAQFDYVSAVTSFIVAGQDEPVALIGQRQAAGNVAINVTTLATAQSNALRALVKQAAVLLFRPLPGWASALPGLLYVASATISELPLNEKYGGQMVAWKIPATAYAPPASNVVVPTTTYGTVAGSYATYADFNNAHAGLGQTYLDVLKNP